MNFREEDLPDPLSRLYRYWLSKRTGRQLPSRLDIDPVEMRGFLPHTVLMDVVRGTRFRLRLVGTHITSGCSLDLSGQYLDQVEMGAMRQVALDASGHCISARVPHYLNGEIRRVSGHAGVMLDLLGLPLAAADAPVNMLLVGVRIQPLI